MGKKNVAIFGIKYFPSRGGTSRVAENLLLNLSKEYNFTIYCYRHSGAKTHIKGVNVIEIPEIKLGNLGVFLYYFICYCHIRFIGNYHIVHAHKIDSFYFLKGLSKKSKVIATAHEAPYKRDKWGKFAKLFFKVCEKRFLKFPGIKTPISKPLCDYYKEAHGVEIMFIPNGINLDESRVSGKLHAFWPENVPLDSSFILFAARRIMGTKGLHTLLEALKKIDYRGNVFVAGELDNYPNYMKKIRDLSKGLNIFFLGFVEPLSSVLALVDKCDYFVFPSETEGMSIMLLEVASTGRPIVASDIPENTQVFNENDVLFFKNKNVDDLAEKLLWIEKNKSEFLKFGFHAKNKVSSSYTWDKIASKYMKLY